ncbi:ATP-dependent helicase [Helicobacter cholecystus]|uniref:ATP-dependent helicase n=1 Tax=Helicobacter cholecystus TaxID=45498 RepID=UPI000F6F28C0|nr:UvrD-helicase domain-containing protein [Helicobacter cholecystus]VEJ24767.1 ATP-dependent DNA helicase [Helicobacter cholecystus]
MIFLEGLNSKQREAVEYIDGALLLLAGAGSGKTKTLISRLAYLIGVVGIDPSSILCLTFTNKASVEMRERAIGLLRNEGMGVKNPPLLCTFHKFGLLFLKHSISYLDRECNFVLIDSDDAKKIIKSFESKIATSTLLSAISFYKNATLSPSEVLQNVSDTQERQIAKIYEQYQDYLKRNNLVDFDDLLYLTYLVLEQNPSLAQDYSKKYSYIMVDEYQDTNPLQYKILKLLTCTHQNLCVVGDDDQSIYGWRGADIRNILEFTQDFRDAKMIKLEQNYRSTPEILKVANALIEKNSERLGKVLEPMLESGREVQVNSYKSDRIEMEAISKKIKALHQEGVEFGDIAILYRLNGMSKGVEDGLLKARLPYKMIGTVRFYERAEIKDVVSYLRVMVNIDDDFSLLRVLNRPKRGFGKASEEKLLAGARGRKISEFFANENECKSCIGEKNYKILKEFFILIAELKDALLESFEKFEDFFSQRINILNEYPLAEREERGSNLKELFTSLKEEIKEGKSLEDFLNELSLSSDADKEMSNSISCMSIHLSKGLEFDYVFVIGCENGFFPLLGESGDMEEERRLGYVAFTRAKKELYLSYAHTRYYRGKASNLPPSRFLYESNLLSDDCQEVFSLGGEIMSVGAMVRHKIFGIGRVLEVSGKGKEMKVRVSFGGSERMILASFLELL